MSLIRSHDCPKCGAALLYDDEKQVYICPYCDKSYQFDYFNEDKLLSFAFERIHEKDFGTAREALEFLSKKSSPGFPALCGLWLARSEISSVDSLSIDSHHLTQRGDDLKPYLEQTKGSEKAYFQHIKEADALYEEYQDTRKQILALKSKEAVLEDKVMRIKMRIEARKKWVWYALKWIDSSDLTLKLFLYIFVFMLTGLSILGIYLYTTFGATEFYFLYGSFFAVFLLTYFLQKTVKIRKLNEALFSVIEEINELRKKKDELLDHEHEVSRAYYDKLQSAKQLEWRS